MSSSSSLVGVRIDVNKLADDAESLLPNMWIGALEYDAADFVVNHALGQADSESVKVYAAVLGELMRRKKVKEVSQRWGGFVAHSGASLADIEDRAPVLEYPKFINGEGQMHFGFLSEK